MHQPGGAHQRAVDGDRQRRERHDVVGLGVEPRVRLGVQAQPAQPRLGQVAEQASDETGAVGAEGLPRAVERLAVEPEADRSAEVLHERVRQAELLAAPLEVDLGQQVAVVVGAQPLGHLVVGQPPGREERAQQLGVPVAVVALPVVLHGELPVAVLDQVGLRGDLGAGQLVRGDVRRHHPRDVLDVDGRLGGQADEQQPGDLAQVDRAQPEPLPLGGGRQLGCVQQAAVGAVGPVVVAAHDVADAAVGLRDQTRPPVAADVAERPEPAVVVAQHHHRGAAEVDGEEVALLGDLRDRADEDPLPLPDQPQVELVQGRVAVAGAGQGVPCRTGVEEVEQPAASSGATVGGERSWFLLRGVGQTVTHSRSAS